MVTKEIACQVLLGAVYRDAFDIADQIIQELRDEGIVPSLDDPACQNAFALDWFVARLAYLHVSAGAIEDAGLRVQLRTEIEASLDDVSTAINDAKDCFGRYCMLAMDYLDGIRDPLGLPPGPGPFLSLRYDQHVQRVRAGGHSDRRDLQTTDSESILISTLGDGACWTLNGKLEEILSLATRA